MQASSAPPVHFLKLSWNILNGSFRSPGCEAVLLRTSSIYRGRTESFSSHPLHETEKNIGTRTNLPAESPEKVSKPDPEGSTDGMEGPQSNPQEEVVQADAKGHVVERNKAQQARAGDRLASIVFPASGVQGRLSRLRVSRTAVLLEALMLLQGKQEEQEQITD